MQDPQSTTLLPSKTPTQTAQYWSLHGDFNQTSLTKAVVIQTIHKMPYRYQNIRHCYSTIKNAYHVIPRAPLGNSDHAMIYLVSNYTQKRKSAKPTRKTVKKRTPEAVASLQGCSECTDWSVFRKARADLDDHTDTVASYVSFCEESSIPSKTVTIKMQ